MATPTFAVPRVPVTWLSKQILDWPWPELPSLEDFRLSVDDVVARQQTQVRLCHDERALFVRFDCQDDDIWGTYMQRGDPLYEQEVVEVFIAPGHEAPTTYFELEVSPKGVLFECIITHSASEAHYNVDETWRAKGVQWFSEASPKQSWWAVLVIPWQALGGYHEVWRANFYRIERSRRSGTEYSCWSATLSPSFHVPSRFGTLMLSS